MKIAVFNPKGGVGKSLSIRTLGPFFILKEDNDKPFIKLVDFDKVNREVVELRTENFQIENQILLYKDTEDLQGKLADLFEEEHLLIDTGASSVFREVFTAFSKLELWEEMDYIFVPFLWGDFESFEKAREVSSSLGEKVEAERIIPIANKVPMEWEGDTVVISSEIEKELMERFSDISPTGRGIILPESDIYEKLKRERGTLLADITEKKLKSLLEERKELFNKVRQLKKLLRKGEAENKDNLEGEYLSSQKRLSQIFNSIALLKEGLKIKEFTEKQIEKFTG